MENNENKNNEVENTEVKNNESEHIVDSKELEECFEENKVEEIEEVVEKKENKIKGMSSKMKKVIILLVVLLLVVVGIAGYFIYQNFKTDSVTCAYDYGSDDYKMSETFESNKDGEITAIINDVSITLSDEALETQGMTFKEYYKSNKENLKNYEDIKGFSYELSKDDDKQSIHLVITYDLTKYNFKKDELSMGEKSNYSDVESVISTYKTYGYTCE